MEKKIGLWCNKWLSLGGRFVLVKAILESQPVYWMSLETISHSILNKIKKLMFNFLWSGNKTARLFHLCRWDTLSRPKKFGGWGLQNLPLFNTNLLVNNLWRVLTQGDIWRKVIMDKYLYNTTVVSWYKQTSHKQHSASRIWNSLTSTIHVILHQQSWCPGSGHLISIGRDWILGLGGRMILLDVLITHLKQKRITVLAQATISHNVGSIS
jgi:hypothetical protein